MTNASYDRKLTLERNAYEKVRNAWLWMSDHARTGTYTDDYLLAISKTSDASGVMPIAEVLMCLLNTLEPRYQQLGFPAVAPEVVNKVVADLLKAFADHGFSGFPYLRVPESDVQPAFTDSVCYLLGAMVRVVENPALRLDRDDDCRQVINQATAWLLDARVEVPSMRKETGPLWGWSWTSAKEVSRLSPEHRTKFKDRLPPQTYFTSQVLITLCEALFDSYTTAGKNREPILHAILAAKRFLLSGVTEVRRGDRQWAGWEDFTEDVAQATGAKGMVPYGKVKRQGLRPDMGLYPLEALSYLRYYSREVQYQVVRSELRELHGFSELDRFSLEEDEKLDAAFSYCLQLIKDTAEKPLEWPTEIQIPEPLNLAPGKTGLLESGGTTEDRSLYLDGTVPYNLLNAMNFYVRYREQNSANGEDFQAWRALELDLVDSILGRGFVTRAFAHASAFEEQRKEAIYATRAAVAALLSWGVARPEEEEGAGVPSRIADLVRQLYLEVGGPQGSDSDGEVKENVLDLVQDVLSVGFHIGLFAMELRKISEKDFDKLPEYFELPDNSQFDKKTAIKSNGIGLVRRLGAVIVADENEAQLELQQLIASPHLSIVYRKVFEKLDESFPRATATERVGLLREIVEAPWPPSVNYIKEDVCGV